MNMRLEMMLIHMVLMMVVTPVIAPWMLLLLQPLPIVVSQRALSVQPHADSQRCNLFQTKALVGPNTACKVIIGGSCRNLTSKELCAKLNLKHLPHPNPYYI